METTKMANQIIGFQKTLFESAFSAMCAVQEQTEKIANGFLEQMSWVPEDGKKNIKEAMDLYKEARTNFKKAVDEGFEQLEKLLAGK
jgi:hypothetical protein